MTGKKLTKKDLRLIFRVFEITLLSLEAEENHKSVLYAKRSHITTVKEKVKSLLDQKGLNVDYREPLDRICKSCDGTGTVIVPNPEGYHEEKCSWCYGKGSLTEQEQRDREEEEKFHEEHQYDHFSEGDDNDDPEQ